MFGQEGPGESHLVEGLGTGTTGSVMRSMFVPAGYYDRSVGIPAGGSRGRDKETAEAGEMAQLAVQKQRGAASHGCMPLQTHNRPMYIC